MEPTTIKNMGRNVKRIPPEYFRFPDEAIACGRCGEDWLKLDSVEWANQHGRLNVLYCPHCSWHVRVLHDNQTGKDYWVWK